MDKFLKNEVIVEQIFIGSYDSKRSVITEKLYIDWDGVRRDRHYGRTKFAGVREGYLPKGTEMINLRQVALNSVEEMEEVATDMGIGAIAGEELGANIVLKGIPNLSKLPFGTILQFERAVNLMLTGDNYPCYIPAKEIQKRTKTSDVEAMKFIKTAMHKRGVVAMVLRPGIIKSGDKIKIIIPKEVVPYDPSEY